MPDHPSLLAYIESNWPVASADLFRDDGNGHFDILKRAPPPRREPAADAGGA